MLDLPAGRGLVNVLRGEAPAEEAIAVIGGAGGFHFLPAGSTRVDPSRLLHGERLARLMARARESFDIVIVNSPPVLPVPDALTIGRWVNGAVLRWPSTTADTRWSSGRTDGSPGRRAGHRRGHQRRPRGRGRLPRLFLRPDGSTRGNSDPIDNALTGGWPYAALPGGLAAQSVSRIPAGSPGGLGKM